MATSKIAVSEGSGKNVSTYSFTEDAVTKEVQRVVINTSAGVETTTNGFATRISFTRPSNATAYTANDVVGPAGAACLTFTNMRAAAGEVVITSATLEMDRAAIASGETTYLLHLYNVIQPSAQADNDAFDVPSGDRTAYLGSLNLGGPADLGSTLYVATDIINKQVTMASTSLFGVLVTVGAYTPTSAAVTVVTLHTVAI